MTEEQICEKLQQVLKPGRYRHTLGVADTAERMATVWHVSPAQARLAGLLHDCGKEAGDALSHGPIGARLACTDYGVTDKEILSAIACHTTGKPDMTVLEQVIYLADAIEPTRRDYPGLAQIRALAQTNLSAAVLLSMRRTREYVLSQGHAFCPQTELAMQSLAAKEETK